MNCIQNNLYKQAQEIGEHLPKTYLPEARVTQIIFINPSIKLKHNISYHTNPSAEIFKVYISYKSQLKSYSKKQFDPFNRTQRINFYYTPEKFITTTISQLNFFRWAIEYNVIDYIKDHIEDIDKDMNASLNYVYKKTGEKTDRKKRKALSISATKFLNKDDITILVKIT